MKHVLNHEIPDLITRSNKIAAFVLVLVKFQSKCVTTVRLLSGTDVQRLTRVWYYCLDRLWSNSVNI